MERLKEIMEERGLSRIKVAEKAGLNPATIYRIVNGERSPTVETLEKLAEALNVEVADFFPKAQAPLPFEDAGERGETPSLEENEQILLVSWVVYLGRWTLRWLQISRSEAFDKGAFLESSKNFEDVMHSLLPLVENLKAQGVTARSGGVASDFFMALNDAVETSRLVAEAAIKKFYTENELVQIKKQRAKQKSAMDQLQRAAQ